MIAAAGYLNYSGRIFGDSDQTAETSSELASQELLDISEEDLASASGDIESQDSDVEGTPGEAVLTSGGISNYEENLTIHNENGMQRRFNAIRTEAQATHGSSGGPVVITDTMRVIGVLHGGMNESGFFMNLASDITQLLSEKTLHVLI